MRKHFRQIHYLGLFRLQQFVTSFFFTGLLLCNEVVLY
jgi:hypothetical protein